MFSELFLTKLKIDTKGCNPQEYPFNLQVVRNNATISFDNRLTFIVGENASGKSTLIEAIAVAYGFNAEGGSTSYRFATQQTHSNLHEHITLVKGIKRPKENYYFRGESFYTTKSYMEEIGISYGNRALHNYSHGESFLVLMTERFHGNGLYLFDEPEAALSPQSQMRFIVKMSELLRNNSQLIIATHSPILLAYPQATIYQINSEGTLESVAYEDTDYYALYRHFLNNHQRFVAQLIREAD